MTAQERRSARRPLRADGRQPGSSHVATRIRLALLAAICGIVSIVAVAVLGLRPRIVELSSISDDHARALAIVSAIRGEMGSLRSTAVQAALDRDEEGAAAAAQRYEGLQERAGALRPFADTVFERVTLDRLLSLIRACGDHARGVARAVRSADDPAMMRTIRALLAVSDGTQSEAQALVLFNASQVQASARHLRRSLWELGAGLAVAAAMVIASAAFLFRSALTGFRKYSQALEGREREMSAFAGRAAHELRGPLQATLLSLSAARETADRSLLRRAEESVRRLARIVDRLLEFARSGGTPVPGASCEVAPIVEGVAGELSARFHEVKMELSRDVEPGLTVGMDETYVRAILSNLASNALKYGHGGAGGRCRIVARAIRGAASIDVEDDGPGIPATALPFVFDPLFQASARRDGIGLGLATVKRLVTAHGGIVTVESADGKGTRFQIQLPLVRGAHVAVPSPHVEAKSVRP